MPTVITLQGYEYFGDFGDVDPVILLQLQLKRWGDYASFDPFKPSDIDGVVGMQTATAAMHVARWIVGEIGAPGVTATMIHMSQIDPSISETQKYASELATQFKEFGDRIGIAAADPVPPTLPAPPAPGVPGKPNPSPYATSSAPVWPWIVTGGAALVLGAVVFFSVRKKGSEPKRITKKYSTKHRYA
jgi:hypothetical protein